MGRNLQDSQQKPRFHEKYHNKNLHKKVHSNFFAHFGQLAGSAESGESHDLYDNSSFPKAALSLSKTYNQLKGRRHLVEKVQLFSCSASLW